MVPWSAYKVWKPQVRHGLRRFDKSAGLVIVNDGTLASLITRAIHVCIRANLSQTPWNVRHSSVADDEVMRKI